MPKIPKLTNAFFGFSLAKGTQIVAISFIVLFSIVFVGHIVQAFIPPYEEEEESSTNVTSVNNATTTPTPPRAKFADLRSTTFFLEVSVIVQIVFSVFLLIGVQKTIQDYLMSWILLQIGFFFHSQVLVIANAVFALYHYPTYILYFIGQEILVIAIVTYCILVVYSYYRDLQSADEAEIPPLTPGNG
uniref:Putative conserved plasma membrane protein n=1 Tax=Panstrongylus lignarius TaxID=156445 RepID=A0A224XQD4_9HEMI